jgi:hypothetical protein
LKGLINDLVAEGMIEKKSKSYGAQKVIAMPYEHNMFISYDGVSRTVTVYFRGKRTVLSGTYSTWEAGMRAGKEFCRFQGWFG